VLFQMLHNGELVFKYDNVLDYYYAHKYEMVRPFRSRLFPVIVKCLNKDPNERYQNFKELREDLEKLYRRNTGEDPPIPPKEEELEAWEHMNKGISFYSLGFIDEALAEFQTTLEIRPGHYKAYIHMGDLYKDQKNYSKAIESYKKSLKIKPHQFQVHNRLGKTFKKIGEFNKAIDEFLHSIKINPNFVEGHFNLAKTHEEAKDIDNAIAIYTNFIESAPRYYAPFIKEAKKLLHATRKKNKD